jgi:hypothetical protein
MAADLLALSDWLAEAGITHVAMESTGELAHIDFLDEQIDALSAEIMRDPSELEADALPPPPAHLARATGEVGSEASQEAPSFPGLAHFW